MKTAHLCIISYEYPTLNVTSHMNTLYPSPYGIWGSSGWVLRENNSIGKFVRKFWAMIWGVTGINNGVGVSTTSKVQALNVGECG